MKQARRALKLFEELSELLPRTQVALGRFTDDPTQFNEDWVEAENALREVMQRGSIPAAREVAPKEGEGGE